VAPYNLVCFVIYSISANTSIVVGTDQKALCIKVKAAYASALSALELGNNNLATDRQVNKLWYIL
jgi:hypothetical protein